MTMTGYVWLLAGTATVTYVTRFPSLWVGRAIRITPRVKRGLDYIPIGVFAAMIAPSIALHPLVHHHWDVPFFAATAVSLLTAGITKSPLWTMIVGVAAITLFRLLF